jgi:hypothetical protein
MSQSKLDLITSLFIQALREGQSLWFRVASNSMFPLLRKGDEVYIQPAQVCEIRLGEIVAFETSSGLVIHRIIAIEHTPTSMRLLQMSDVELMASWVKEQAVVGRVVSVRSKSKQIDLQSPIAKWCGTVTARIRHRLYMYDKNMPSFRIVLRGCSRIAIQLSYWCIYRFCSSPVRQK